MRESRSDAETASRANSNSLDRGSKCEVKGFRPTSGVDEESAESDSEPGGWPLLVAQRQQRVETGRAARREIAGREAHKAEDERPAGERRRVRGGYAKQI